MFARAHPPFTTPNRIFDGTVGSCRIVSPLTLRRSPTEVNVITGCVYLRHLRAEPKAYTTSSVYGINGRFQQARYRMIVLILPSSGPTVEAAKTSFTTLAIADARSSSSRVAKCAREVAAES